MLNKNQEYELPVLDISEKFYCETHFIILPEGFGVIIIGVDALEG